MADPRLRVIIEALNEASGEIDKAVTSVEALAEQTDVLSDAQGRATDSNADLQDELKGTGAATEDATRANEGAGVSFTELNSMIGIAQKAYQALQAVYGEVVTKTLEVASAQRELALAGQISVEEAGQLIQIADDLKISSDQLKTAFKAMKNEGLEPSIATIKNVAAAYQAAETPLDKLNVASEGLGRSYQDLLPLLELTPQRIDEMAASASRAGLVMSEEAVQAARDYELAVDDLNDSWQAFTVSVGTGVIPTLNEALTSMNDNRLAMQLYAEAVRQGALSDAEMVATQDALKFKTEEVAVTLQRLQTALALASEGKEVDTSFTRSWGDATLYAAQAQERAAAAIEATNAASINLPQVWRDAKAALGELNLSTEKRIELEQRLAIASGQVTADDILRQETVNNLTEQFDAGQIKQEEYFAKLEELAGGAVTVRTSFEEMGHGTVNYTADADKMVPTLEKANVRFDEQAKAVDLAKIAVAGYGSLLAAQNAPEGDIYDYVVGLSKITGEALAAGAAIRAIPGLPGTSTPRAGGPVIGAADGLHMTVPSGFPNDSFGPIYAESGETIDIGRGGGSGPTIIIQAANELDVEYVAHRVVRILKGDVPMGSN